MDSDVVDELVRVLDTDDSSPHDFLVASAAVVRAVTTGDDERPFTSKAFNHARALANTVSAHKVLLKLLRKMLAAGTVGSSVALLTALRQVCANDDICKEAADEGAVDVCCGILQQGQSGSARDLVTACCGTLKQLANSDMIKVMIANRQGIQLLCGVLSAYSADSSTVEQALGVLAAMTLRQPDICTSAAEAGLPDLLMEVMGEARGKAGVQRVAAMLVRNMVVRTPELREVFLSKGMEAALREAKAAHPAHCKDVGSAALRDLGLDNYND